MKVLVVEDEAAIREVIKAYLKRSDFEVVEASDGVEALEIFDSEKPDLILLDINLPKIDGIEVCRRIRNVSKVPIIMVTAKVEEIDEIIGLEIGSDDYIKKPFSPNILVARVQALLRRNTNGELKIADLIIDPEKMIVKKNDEKILLTTTQFNILYTLASNPGKVFSRSEILDRAYDNSLESDVLDRTVDAHIKAIRKAIENDHSNPNYILTIIGKGYKFNDELK